MTAVSAALLVAVTSAEAVVVGSTRVITSPKVMRPADQKERSDATNGAPGLTTRNKKLRT